MIHEKKFAVDKFKKKGAKKYFFKIINSPSKNQPEKIYRKN